MYFTEGSSGLVWLVSFGFMLFRKTIIVVLLFFKNLEGLSGTTQTVQKDEQNHRDIQMH